MKFFSFLLLLSMMFANGYSQVYVTVDPDGYTNIRKRPSAKSEIMTTVSKYDIFYDANSACLTRPIEHDTNPNWMPVHISDDEGEGYGFIYRKNIRDMEKFPRIGLKKNQDLEVVYQDGDLSVTFRQDSLFSNRYKVKADETEFSYMNVRINGEEPYHTLYKGNTLVLDEISFVYKGVKQIIPREQYKSVFRLGFEHSDYAMAVYKGNQGIYYIHVLGGGAEESYELTWVVDKGEIRKYNYKEICELPDL